MVIRLVVFDADMTLWDHSDISSLILPFKRVDRDSLIDAEENPLNLFNGIRELLQELKKKRIIVALATWNKPEQVVEAIRLLEIEQFFKFVEAEFHPNKHLLVRNILCKLSKEGIKVKPSEVLYVDDQKRHLKDIYGTVGKVVFLQMWNDVKNPHEISAYIQQNRYSKENSSLKYLCQKK